MLSFSNVISFILQSNVLKYLGIHNGTDMLSMLKSVAYLHKPLKDIDSGDLEIVKGTMIIIRMVLKMRHFLFFCFAEF